MKAPLASRLPLTPALLRLDPMFDPLRKQSALPRIDISTYPKTSLSNKGRPRGECSCERIIVCALSPSPDSFSDREEIKPALPSIQVISGADCPAPDAKTEFTDPPLRRNYVLRKRAKYLDHS